MTLAPIVLFVYNRPWHTTQTINYLKKNELAAESDLIIFSDNAKDNAASIGVKAVRNYIKQISGFKSITIIERKENWGLSKSIIAGVRQVVNSYGKIIVLEDDHLTSPFFLKYMNESLELYQNEEKVISIHGYMYPVKSKLPTTFFIKGADCWGWGTWKRGWDLFEENGALLLQQLKEHNLIYAFDFNNTYPYTQMLLDQIAGKNSSWAVRWYASAFINNKLTLYPGKSLIKNIGNDDSGTHAVKDVKYDTEVSLMPIDLYNIPIEENPHLREIIANYFKNNNGFSIKSIIKMIRAKF